MGSPHLPPPPLLDPAWYPDPTGRYEARYWDGRRWTSHISHYGATGSDPLLRARWDRWYLRILGRVVLWAAIIGAGWWAYETYWPSDDRDLAAEQEALNGAALAVTDLPPGEAFGPTGRPAVSPLGLEVDDEGVPAIPACEPLADTIGDAGDEPSTLRSFESADGLHWIGQLNTMGGGAGFAKGYLEELRTAEAGGCLVAMWLAPLPPEAFVVDTVQAMSEPSFGDEAVWWRISGVDATGAFQLPVVVDVVAVRDGRVVSEYTFSGSVDPLGVDVQRDTISAGTRRIDAMLAELDAEDESEDDDGELDGPGGEAPLDSATDPQGDQGSGDDG